MKFLYLIKHPSLILLKISNLGIITLSDDSFLKKRYLRVFGKKLDLKNPKTFNEKLQWLKLYDRNPEYINMVDKYEVKKYISKKIGKEYIIPTLGIYNNFDEIDFDNLPNQFVIKCTHDSGSIVLCNDKSMFDKEKCRNDINKALSKNYYFRGREWPYKNVKPRILIEQYMVDKKNRDLRDYKFFCFNGKVEFFKIDFDRFINHGANYYDRTGNLMYFGELVCEPNFEKKINMPINLDKMIELAEKLSRNILFLRVDFYEIENKIYFGELTFYPASGFGKFVPDEWDKKLGDLIELPIDK